MTQTTARIKQGGKHFEILVDMDKAIGFKKGGNASIGDVLEIEQIFTDAKRGLRASESELKKAFGSDDVSEIAARIVKNGEIQVTQEHRDEEKEKKFKQVVDFLVKNSVDPRTGNPHTPDRIKSALEESHANVKNTSIESQIKEIVAEVSKILPLKIGTKKIKIIVPAIHTGKVYGFVNQYKEKENWLANGDLEAELEIPSGMLMDFYDKLNSATHGSALAEEIKE